ncbi:MAG: cobalamin B12-binding domain-containing protein [Promethearchaeota archaeon]
MSNEEALIEAVVEMDENKVYDIVKKMINEGIQPKEIIEMLGKGVEIVGDKFNKKEYFLTELVMAGEIFTQAVKIMEPIIKEKMKEDEKKETVIVGTVKGDVHDIGKNIFVTLLQAAGFNVIDLGVDVPPEKFVEKAKETNAKVVGYSGLLTVALESMKMTTEEFKKVGLRDKIKIIIGGLPVDEYWMKEAGADGFTDNAFEGVNIVKNWLRGEA